jgi:ribose/xylose/arabinose/galactoside ABC-type transport system permease subunit
MGAWTCPCAVSALVAAVTAQLIVAQVPSGLAALIGLVIALVIGLVNSFLIGAFRLPGLLVTLVVGILARGLVLEALQGQTIPVNPENTGFLPVIGWIFFILIAAAAFLWIQLPGVNARLAERKSRVVEAVRSGAPYLFSALTAGIVGLVLVNYFQAAIFNLGQNMEFDSLVVIILAGTCLYGRFGNIVAVIPAALAVTQIKFFVAVSGSPAAVSFIILAVIGLFSLGWLYLYHWIVGLLYRSGLRKKAAAPSA